MIGLGALTRNEVLPALLERCARRMRQGGLACRVELYPTVGALTRGLRERRVHLVILDPDLPEVPRDSGVVTRWLEDFLRLTGTTPILVWASDLWLGHRRLLELGRLGVREVVRRGSEDQPQALTPLLERIVRGRRFDALVRALPSRTPLKLAYCLAALTIAPHEWRSPTPEDLARTLSCDRSTVFRKFKAVGLLPPREMIGWLRVYLVFCLVEEGLPAERAAMSVGFGSVGNFRSMAAGRLGIERSEVPAAMAKGSKEVLERLSAILRSEVA